jgi:hypothetical protein
MKLRFFALLGAAIMSLASMAHAGHLYMIANRNSLVTANLSDLETFFSLQGNHAATRAFYNQVAARDGLVNLQPGAIVNVLGYYDNNIAEISWDNGAQEAYIATDDLSVYIGAN